MVVAAAKTLVQSWLMDSSQGEVLALLKVLDVRQNPGALPPPLPRVSYTPISGILSGSHG